jgi:undecaprenyl-phosphate 4-deoxy-4-formamido-L-arabinose transferase
MTRISFVVPVYNGARMVEQLLERLIPVGRAFGTFEVLFVDDGSRDSSFETLVRLQQRVPEVCAIQLSRNFGQHNATLAGLAHASGDIVITIDQDLQNPPEEVFRMVEKLEEGFDVVYGIPQVRAHNAFRNLTSEFSKWLGRQIFATAQNGNFSSFRAMRKWLVTEVVQYNSGYIYLDGLINWTTSNVGSVQVRNDQSEVGSQYSFFRLVNHGMNLLVNFSIKPLQIASVVGAFCALLGLGAALYIVLAKIFYNLPVQGWASLMVVVLVLGGVQIAFLGLIGEYIGRILMNSNRSPKYIVRDARRSVLPHDN